MSMNIHIESVATVRNVNGRGREFEYRQHFDCWQTPTSVTHQILEAEDKIRAYMDWVMSRTQEEFVERYEDYDDDIRASMQGLGGCPPPSKLPVKVRYHVGEEHCCELEKFIADEREKGCDIDVYMM